MVSVRVQLIIR